MAYGQGVQLSKCIEGKGNSFSGNGYSTIQVNGKRIYQHRLVAVLFHGLEMQDTTTLVLHSCDNPKCINPEHLRLGSARENMQDCLDRSRHVAKGLQGEKNPRAKLTAKEVADIRKLKDENPELKYTVIAKHFKVNERTISLICRRKLWV